MQRELEKQFEKLNRRHRRKRAWFHVVRALACMTVFVTTYVLILPAITMEQDTAAVCGCMAHTHTEACFGEMGLLCDMPKHEHDMTCFGPTAESVSPYDCGSDYEHVHSEDCYVNGVLICSLSEHTHGGETCAAPQDGPDEAAAEPQAEPETESQAEPETEPGVRDEPEVRDEPAEQPEQTELPEGPGEEPAEDGGLTEDPAEAPEEDPEAPGDPEETDPENGETAEMPMEYAALQSAPAEDGATALVSGLLPVGAQPEISVVHIAAEELAAYFGQGNVPLMTDFVAYDIRIVVNGEEWQPDETVLVTVCQPDITVNGGETLSGVHVDGETAAISDVEVTLEDTGNVSFEADGFSTYIFFTVDFSYEGATFSMAGCTWIKLSELFQRLNIGFAVEDVADVRFSDESLISVARLDDGDWLLTSLASFDTDETLTVTFTNGAELTVDVTDPPGVTYWERVTEIDDASANYMVVAANANVAFGAKIESYILHKVDVHAVTMTPDSTSGGYYLASPELSETFMWRFSGTGSPNGMTNVGLDCYFNLNTIAGDIISVLGATQNTMTYSDGTWKISYRTSGWGATTYYLAYSGGTFVRQTGDSNNTFYIYKQMSETTRSNSGANTKYAVAAYAVPEGGGTAAFLGYQTVDSSVTSSAPLDPTALFNSFNTAGLYEYAGAYYGTASTPARNNVTGLYRGGSSSYNLVVASTDGDLNVNASGDQALYIRYRPAPESVALPSTGGTGVLPYAAAGLTVMALAAAGILFLRRREKLLPDP